MPKQEENVSIILPDDPRAAQRRTVTGWVSRKGIFFGDDEYLARRNGATHLLCSKCKAPISKKRGNGICRSCREKTRAEEYEKRPKVEYDGEMVCYSDSYDVYFFDEESIEEYMDEHDVDYEDLMLRNTTPNYLHEVTDDYWEEVFPDGGSDLPPDVDAKLAELNDAIRDAKPMSYSPGPNAVTFQYRLEMINDRWGQDPVKFRFASEFERAMEKCFDETPKFHHIEDGDYYYEGPYGPERTLVECITQ